MFRARWRRWIRDHTPGDLYERGLVIPKVADCRDHEWYLATQRVHACYHCRVIRKSPDSTMAGFKALRQGNRLNGLSIRELIDEGRR